MYACVRLCFTICVELQCDLLTMNKVLLEQLLWSKCSLVVVQTAEAVHCLRLYIASQFGNMHVANL